MQKLQLSIPEPCHENWQQMTPTDQGRFCNACAKEVIDFSTMTDIQVLNYFTNMTNEKVCGRALPEQLDRTISRPAQPKKRLFWYWNYFVMFFIFFAKGNNAKAQNCTKPSTELSPAKNVELRGDVVIVAGQMKSESRQIISGVILDSKNNTIPFASVKVKGTLMGVSADVNGVFKINTELNSVLTVSSSGFNVLDVPVGNQKELKITLENRYPYLMKGEVVIMGSVGSISYHIPEKQNMVALVKVKDYETDNAVGNATIIFLKKYSDKADTVFTDTKGAYKMKGIKARDNYQVKVQADGYEPNEFTIKGRDFEERKKEWEVLLRKKKVNELKPITVNPAFQTSAIRLGGVSSINSHNQPLLVVDGLLVPLGQISSVEPKNVDSIKILKGLVALALYGSDGKHGVIVITTKKKTKAKTEMVKDSIAKKVLNKISDKLSHAINTNTVKIYPNPIQRGYAFFVSFKNLQVNDINIRITDLQGRIMIQKQVNVAAKEHLERIDTNASWSSGTYYISVFDKENKLISNTSFIVQ